MNSSGSTWNSISTNTPYQFFLPESGQPKEALQRKFLAKEVNIAEDATTRSVPLLYSLLAKSQNAPSNPSHINEYTIPTRDSMQETRPPRPSDSSRKPPASASSASSTRQISNKILRGPPPSIHNSNEDEEDLPPFVFRN